MSKKKWFLGLLIATLLVAFAGPAGAQETAVKGNLAGTVYDSTGAVVPGAKVTLSGPMGTKSETSDGVGSFVFPLLVPGLYSVRVEKQGFNVAEVKDIEVFTNRTAAIRVTLKPGAITQVIEVTEGAVAVDTSSTAVSANLNDTFYTKIPLQRGIAGIFYLSPGVVSGGASGFSNPSISGGSGLENQYVADGVNITDAAFGGLGVFSRVYGSLATGINLSFVKEVQVKTGGYEPQYGKSTGGIVQIVTKSGGSEYHGGIGAFFQPTELEKERRNPDDAEFRRVNKVGKLVNTAGYDVHAELGGYIPGFKDKIFFFGSYNPAETQRLALAPVNAGLFAHGPFLNRTFTHNWAGKLTWKLSDKHQIESSGFGDPAHTGTGPFRRLRMDNNTAFSKLQFGTKNWATRYNGAITPTWSVNASFTWDINTFSETGFANLNEIVDQTQTFNLPGQRGEFVPVGLGFNEPTEANTFGVNVDTQKTFHFGGSHTFSVGYRLERPFYDGSRTNSGPTYIVPGCNANNPSCTTTPSRLRRLGSAIGTEANQVWRITLAPDTANPVASTLFPSDPTCTLCPFFPVPGITGPGPNGMSRVLLRIFRSEFGLQNGVASFSTNGTYHAAYVNDSWSPSKYVTMNLGLRWEQQALRGGAISYTFTDNWSPRVGVVVDPKGDRKSKLYANFSRLTYAIPLDLAERALTNELDLFGLRTAPQFTVDSSGNRIAVINQFGTVNPVPDAAHVLNGASGGIARSAAASFESIEPIFPGTKMSYLDEFVVGAEHEFRGGVVLSVRYIRRDLKRIVEDTGGISPEAALAGINQQFAITNVKASTDLFTNPIQHDFIPTLDLSGNITNLPAGCDPDLALFPITNSVGQQATDSQGNTAACFADNGVNGQPAGAAIPDGIPDGFTDPVRQYWAVEFEVNKSFSKNWQMRANWRIARLLGNFEGALRNDNGQTDPSISSLFDFTLGQFNLLGDQFKPGVLNTDRFHIINGQFSYVFDHTRLKGLTLGTGIRIQTGIPINEFRSHPVYENSGEVPVGGRGKLGRTPVTGTVDFHADYPIRVKERWRVRVVADLFNLANTRRVLFVNQNADLAFGSPPNADFLKPENVARLGDAFVAPFQARFGVKIEF